MTNYTMAGAISQSQASKVSGYFTVATSHLLVFQLLFCEGNEKISLQVYEQSSKISPASVSVIIL